MINSIAFLWIEAVGALFLWSGYTARSKGESRDISGIQIAVGLITMWAGAVL
jgi:hypothetical protein